MDKNVIVTGGAGYIGSHVCKKLYQDGYNPISIDNLSRGNKTLVKWGPLYVQDIRDYQKIKKIINEHMPIGVIHLAAFAYVDESIRRPLMYYDNNIQGGFSLIRAMIDCDVKKMVYSSSCSVYGIPENVPISEDCKLGPINPYGKTKLIFEQVLDDLANFGDLDYISLRYFNAAGADPEMETGELHIPETHLIPLAIKASINDNNPLTINGIDYPTSDGTCIRDYIHVSDLAKAHVLALEKLLLPEKYKSRKINLGTGKGHSVFEIIQKVEDLTGRKVKYKIGKRREGDPPELVADILLSKKYFCWFPEMSELTTIISTAVEWSQLNKI